MNGEIGPDPAIYLLVKLGEFRGRERSRAGKVEAQAFWFNQGAPLFCLRTQHISQRFMQQMGSAVVAHSIFAALLDYTGLHAIAYTNMSFADVAIVDDQTFKGAARILYLEDTQRPGDIALIAYLTATFRIKRGYIQHQ